MTGRYWPLGAGRVVTSKFGPRSDDFHWGVDFGRTGGSSNMPVYAAQAGTVVMAGPASGFGHWVVVDHPTEAGSGTTVYGHVIPEVAVGQEVAAGERIAYIDPDEDTNGGVAPHLHFEVHRSVWVPPGPDRLDPLPWLAAAKEPGALIPAGGTVSKPVFTELNRMGSSRSERWGARITNFLLHTQEGNGTAESLAAYLNNPANGASYHYTLRDGIVCDVVDTDYASWSVLDANAQTINLCFAGSRADWTYAQWMAIENDLRIAAWLAVQDAKRYGFSTDVIAPPYTRRDGISDHKYVTECLGIGTHTDCGPNFPWDVFAGHVDAALDNNSQEDDDMTPEQSRRLDVIYDELTKRFPSRSALRKDDKPVDTLAGMVLNADGRVHEASVLVPAQLNRIEAALAELPARIAAAIKEGGAA